jgi:hypothetical protein
MIKDLCLQMRQTESLISLKFWLNEWNQTTGFNIYTFGCSTIHFSLTILHYICLAVYHNKQKLENFIDKTVQLNGVIVF